MKAAVLESITNIREHPRPLSFVDLPDPDPGEGQILVRVSACGVCHTDLSAMTGVFGTDGFPFLLTNDASLRDLQKRCPASVQMEQFRPNLVVTGAQAWEEDTWKVIRIGSVIFDVVKPCSRCIFTTVSPEKGQK